jgi:hypothetical protein
MMHFNNNIAITTARSGGHDVLVERKGDEEDEYKKVYDRTNGAHSFRSSFDHQ